MIEFDFTDRPYNKQHRINAPKGNMKTQALIFAVVVLFLGTDVEAASIKTASGTRKVLTKFALDDDLATVVGNAEDSLTSHVKGWKISRQATAEDLKLSDVFFRVDEATTVELTNVKLSNSPVVGINYVKPNLEFLNMGVDVDLGSLEVTGSFKVASKSVLSVIPATTIGEFSLTFSDVQATGRVGLSLVEDSFTTINYDINFEPKEEVLKTMYRDHDGSILTSVATEQQELSISAKINRELQATLKNILKEEFDDILSEMSVDELMGDTKKSADYRAHAKAVRTVANEYVDEVLLYVHNYVVEQHVEEIQIPNIEAGFSETILWVTWHGEFVAQQGHLRSLASLQRTADVSLEFNSDTGAIIVFGSLGLEELQLGYDYYSAKFMDIGPTGTVGISVGSNSIFVRVNLVIATEPVIGLEDLHIEYAKGINIDVTGLGILDWLVSNIATWVVGTFNDEIVGSLDGMIHGLVMDMLPSVDPSKYFA
ncbi:hypothetical protein C0J52_08711 [Blattella germanica]|nr:hypothetical protein C0J52_08711 [Blattella germanica]